METLQASERLRTEPMAPRPFAIRRAFDETHDTFTMDLTAADGDGDLTFAPGQFNMLYVHGVGEVPISISGDPDRPEIITHTTRAVGTVTRAMRKLRRGDVIGVRGPYGEGWPVRQQEGRDVVIVAGGIGLAPLRPAVYSILRLRNAYKRVVLLYGTRSPIDILYQDELEQWRGRFDMDVYVTVDRGMDKWRGNVGFVSNLIGKAPFDPTNAAALLCGPEVMMRVCATELLKRGIAVNDIHVSLERNMKCAVGFCGHCQLGPYFVCKDGPVFPYPAVREILSRWEL